MIKAKTALLALGAFGIFKATQLKKALTSLKFNIETIDEIRPQRVGNVTLHITLGLSNPTETNLLINSFLLNVYSAFQDGAVDQYLGTINKESKTLDGQILGPIKIAANGSTTVKTYVNVDAVQLGASGLKGTLDTFLVNGELSTYGIKVQVNELYRT